MSTVHTGFAFSQGESVRASPICGPIRRETRGTGRFEDPIQRLSQADLLLDQEWGPFGWGSENPDGVY